MLVQILKALEVSSDPHQEKKIQTIKQKEMWYFML